MMGWSSVNHHVSIKMTRLCMQAVGMWYVEKKRDKIMSNIILSYTVATMFVALIVMGTDFYYSMDDLHAISYNVPCTITVILELLKLLIFIHHRHEVMEFNAFTENTFWKIQYESVDLSILNKCNKQTMAVNIALAILMHMIAWSYLSIPIIESAGKNASERLLPFRLWFDVPYTETPFYEVAFSLQAAATFSVSICTTSFACFLFTICIYATGQFKILQRRLEICCNAYTISITSNNKKDNSSLALAENLTYDELKNCIKQHQLLIRYMDKVEYLYCYIMLGVTLSAVLQICFSGFQILLGANESIQRQALSVEFFIGSVILLYLFSSACHQIIEESTLIAEVTYRASWYDLPCYKSGKFYREAVLMLIRRARKPCTLTVGKFTPMSLKTFTSACNSAISYFMILRQMNEESVRN